MSLQQRIKPQLLVCRDLLVLVADLLFRLPFLVSKPKRDGVAVVRLDGIGDFIVWLRSAQAIRRHYASQRITLVCNRLWYDLAVQFTDFDEIIPVDVRRLRVNWRYRYQTFASLLRRRYEVVINPLYSRNGFSDQEAVVRVLRAKEKIGQQDDAESGWRGWLSRLVYGRLIPTSRQPIMELTRNAEFIRGLGVDDQDGNTPLIPLERLPEVAGSPSETYYILFPGGSSPIRQWPADSFAEAAQSLYTATGFTGLICGPAAEHKAAEEIIAKAGVPLQNWTGRTNLLELSRLISKAKLFVGNETGAIHIAAALSVPSVCILGGGHYGRFMPYDPIQAEREGWTAPLCAIHQMSCFHCEWRCHYQLQEHDAAPCIKQISSADVFSQVRVALALDA